MDIALSSLITLCILFIYNRIVSFFRGKKMSYNEADRRLRILNDWNSDREKEIKQLNKEIDLLHKYLGVKKSEPEVKLENYK